MTTHATTTTMVSDTQGILTMNYTGGKSGWTDIAGEFKAISVKAKNYLPMNQSMDGNGNIGYSMVLRVTMDNGKFYAFRIINDVSVRYGYNRYGAEGAATGWDGWCWIDTKDPTATSLINGAGAEFKVERTAANILTVTMNGNVLDTYTMEGVTASNKVVSVGIQQYGNPASDQYVVKVPFEVSYAREPVKVSTESTGNGAVTTDKNTYRVGDTVSLTVVPNSGYSYKELKVNGTAVTPDNNGKYSFVAHETNYQISASFVKSAFTGATGDHWNLTHQGTGKLMLESHASGHSGWLQASGNSNDITLTAKDYTPAARNFSMIYKFVFSNGETICLRLNGTDTDGKYRIQAMGGSTLAPEWKNFYTLSDAQTAKVTGSGIKFRTWISETNAIVYLDEVKVCTIDLSKNVSTGKASYVKNMPVHIELRMDGNLNNTVTVPFTMVYSIKPITVTIPTLTNGKVTTDKTTCVGGDTVTLTVVPDSGYSYKELKVNGTVVTPDNNGKYTFVAQETNYQISASFTKSTFADSTDTHWNITHQGTGKLVMESHSSGFSGWVKALNDGNDISTVVKDYTPDAKDLSMIYKFTFANGETFTVRLDHTGNDGKYRIQVMSGSTLSTQWKIHHTFTDAQTTKVKGDGIRYRVAIEGTNAVVYLDGTKVCTIDLSKVVATGKSSGILNMPVRVEMRMDGNLNHSVSVPFELKNIAIKEKALTNVVTKIDSPDTLFFRNDNITNLPDPAVLDNTARDGYYMYGTWGAFRCYRSKNMMDWEYCGEVLQEYRESIKVWDSSNKKHSYQVLGSDLWAPEVIYDASTKLYYMFFSATPDVKNQAVKGSTKEVLMVATSTSPSGKFQLVNFKNAASCGSGNVHSYSTSTYSDYFAPYLLLDPAKHRAFSEKINKEWRGANNGGYVASIDPHPYVAPDGRKYLLWVDSYGPDRICGVEMENWLKPKWETATVLTYHNYYTVNDWKNGTNAGVSYENYTTTNEGPFLIERNGKYYLTYSANNWKYNTYLVAQAVSNSVLGPYTKLKESEGGVVLSGMKQGGQKSSGTGHHSILKVGSQLFMIYHRHNDPTVAGSARNHAIDEIKWVTINGREVLYVNGPNVTLQPRVEKHSTYRNIAGEASVSSNSSANPKYLNDGLLSHLKKGHSNVVNAVGETSVTSTTTFAFRFPSARAIKSIMVYNSRLANQAFRQIKQIKLVCVENGELVCRYVNAVPFNTEYYTTNSNGAVNYVEPCSAAYAVFDEMQVLYIEVTVEVPAGQSSVGISEIRILGK